MQDLFITDLDAAQVAPKEFGGTYVHRGFYQYANTLWDLMNDDIKELHRRKKFYVCGHSLGGAGTLLISALLQERYQPSSIHLYTYGMPRTGTSSFVSRYKNILHHRHVNDHDLVPQIPMTWVNTDLAEGADGWDVFSSGVTLAKKMITDNDDLVIIDSLDFPYSKWIPMNLSKLGLEDKEVTHVLVTHGHSDHVGGAQYLQEMYDAEVVMTKSAHELSIRSAVGIRR